MPIINIHPFFTYEGINYCLSERNINQLKAQLLVNDINKFAIYHATAFRSIQSSIAIRRSEWITKNTLLFAYMTEYFEDSIPLDNSLYKFCCENVVDSYMLVSVTMVDEKIITEVFPFEKFSRAMMVKAKSL